MLIERRCEGESCCVCDAVERTAVARVIAYGAMMYWAAVVLAVPNTMRRMSRHATNVRARAIACERLSAATAVYLRSGGTT